MTVTQLSNIFNIIVSQIPKMGSYHFGFQSDLNINVKGNFDDESRGRVFPHLLFMPPSGTYDILASKRVFDITLIISDLLYYGENTTRTNAEVWTRLNGFKAEILRNLNWIAFDSASPHFNIVDNSIEWDLDAAAHNDRLAMVMLKFKIIAPFACPSVSFDPDDVVAPMVYPVEEWDYEDQVNQTP